MEGIEEDHDLEDDIVSAMADADDADLLLLLMLLRLEFYRTDVILFKLLKGI